MDNKQLDNIIKLVNERKSAIKSEKYIKDLVPKLFVQYVDDISFDTNFSDDKNLNYDDYNELNSYGHISFTNGLVMSTDYHIYRRHDWNEGDVDIFMGNNKKLYYEYDNINENNTLKLDKLFLKILDRFKLKNNANNRKMLGILINNLVVQTKIICDSETNYDESIIENEDVDKCNMEFVYIDSMGNGLKS